MTYKNALKFLNSSPGGEDGQSRIRTGLLCSALGRINKGGRMIYVSGGEAGSLVGAYLQAVLSRAGYDAARISGRSLYAKEEDNYREYAEVNGKNAGVEAFRGYVYEVSRAAATVRAENPECGEFRRAELLFAVGLLYAKCLGCEYIIIEGGDERNNIVPVCAPFDICILPSTGYSVTENESVITHGTREVISNIKSGDAYNIITDACAAAGCRITVPAVSEFSVNSRSRTALSFTYRGRDGYIIRNMSKMAENCARMAIEAVCSLRRDGVKIQGSAVCAGLSEVRHPVSCEVISMMPDIIADGATAMSEIRLLGESFPGEGLTVCFPSADADRLSGITGIFENAAYVIVGDMPLPDTDRNITVCRDAAGAAELLVTGNAGTVLCFGNPRFAYGMKQAFTRALTRL